MPEFNSVGGRVTIITNCTVSLRDAFNITNSFAAFGKRKAIEALCIACTVLPVAVLGTHHSTVIIPTWARGTIVTQVKIPKSEKVIALTFDDGPSPPYTRQILKTLKDHHAKATF